MNIFAGVLLILLSIYVIKHLVDSYRGYVLEDTVAIYIGYVWIGCLLGGCLLVLHGAGVR